MTDESVQAVRISPRVARTAPLSRTQTLIWASQRLHPGVPLANMGTRSRIEGAVDPDRFVRAFDRVVAHCDALRTVIAERSSAGDPDAAAGIGERFEARVLALPPMTTSIIDLPIEELDDWSRRRISTAIDATTCVYDSVLIRHDERSWTWWLDIHHVATDAWASALIFEATSVAYASDDRDTDLGSIIDGACYTDPVGIDAAGHDRESFAGRDAAWRAESEEAGPQPPLELYGPRGPRVTETRRVAVPLGADGLQQLESVLDGDYRSISRELGLLTIGAMSMALAVHRLDGRSAVVVGVPVHHRSSKTSRRIVGPLMELYPMTVRVVPGETHAEMYARVLRSVMTVLRRAKPGESPSTPFEIVLNVLTARFGDFADLPTDSEWMRSGHVDPSHVIRSQLFDYAAGGRLEISDRLNWELDVNSSLSADDAAKRFPVHFAAAVRATIELPGEQIGTRSLVGESEQAELALLNPDPAARTPRTTVHEQIRTQLLNDPSWVVAEHRGVEMTAQEFDRATDELAGWLVVQGLVPGGRVGIRLPRGLDALVAIHGVLRAGGVFVMLAPEDPPARHEFITTDAELFTVLDALPATGAEHRDVVLPSAALDDGAYVLYTSGSTGAPKGVPISHAGLADYLAFAVEAYAADRPPPVVALHSSLRFDLTITSLFLSFLTGGRVVVFDEEPIEALARIAADDRVTFIKATPSQLELFVRLVDTRRPLDTVVVGGEAFRRPIAERLAASCEPGVRIFNEYGPTEAVVGCMIHEWDQAADLGADVPIGHAAPGCEIVVLDSFGRLAPTGAWGELFVRRPGMAQSYLNRPELSAERFVRLSSGAAEPGADDTVWYRTGDRVRVERPGVAVYGGRSDDQLKVNGIRLEPGEVEAALVALPEITSALVRLWTPGDGRAIDDRHRCVRCGLGTDVPGVTLDGDGLCNHCRSFDVVAPQAQAWFRTERDLADRLADARHRRTGEIDCLHLLSGGKDSTYALYQLVERGWNVHALTLDNGFISEGAKENIRRSVADLGITHEFASTPAMNAIFRDSLDRHSNVCQGCYKTIYTLAVARAHEMGIPVIVTGLSRGQFFETRLIPHQFEEGRFDPDAIDATVLEARRVYHHSPDAVTELLPEQRVFDDDRIFEEVEFLDFYRYVDVDLAELYSFLETHAPWVRPSDTGRSTNCLINVAGIQVHRSERGYHNYAEPYSWDVRLGHKTRSEALEELDDEIDDLEVTRLLAEVGYEPKDNGRLTAWYQSVDDVELDPVEIRRQLRLRLPEHAIPSAFVRIDEIPLAASAKADPSLLPAPTRFDRHQVDPVEPSTPTEERIAEIWAELLGSEVVGVTDDFFDLGGASLDALETVAAIDALFGTDLPDAAVFRYRTVRELAVLVEQVLGDERHRSRADSIGPLDPGAPLPLAEGQEAMLFEYRMAPDDPRYNVTRLYRIAEGAGAPIEFDRFRDAVRDIVMLHGPLHTSYGPERRAFVHDEALSFEVLEPMGPHEFDAFAEHQRSVPFDLDEGPLVRVHLCRTAPAEISVLVGLHHIGIDAGTFDVLWRQIVDRYTSGAVPALACSYAEHTDWQRRRDRRAAIAYWDEISSRREPASRLGVAPPHQAEPDGYLSTRLPVGSGALAVGRGTPFATAMAATATVLSRFTANAHVAFGITASTKDHADTAELVGYYLNTLPVELDVDLDDRFTDLVERATSVVTEALPHRAYPFASMVRDARRRGFAPPDVSFMLAYEDLATPPSPGVSADQRILASGSAVADVTFFVQERETGVDVGIEYRGAVVSRDDAGRLLDLFESVLTTGTTRADTTLAELVGDAVGADLVGPPLAPVERTTLERFLSRVDHDPDATAVVAADGTSLTYSGLAAAVDALCRQLDQHVSGDGTKKIGIAIGPSTQLVTALLAAQFCRGVYVPLDPSSPPERVRRIMSAARLDVVVTDDGPGSASIVDLVETSPDAPVVLAVESPTGPDGSGDSSSRLRERSRHVDLDDVAYIIFTSGSTGQPRGVEVTHRNLAASTEARAAWYDEAPGRFLLTSSIGFDSSIVGLFWPLTTGGTIVMPGDVHDVDRVAAAVVDGAITHVLMVPSLYRAVLDRAAAPMSSLRVVIVAGESCPAALVERHAAVLPGVPLVNEYGPTEASVWATAHRLDPAEPEVAIGGPIPGATLRLLGPGDLAVPEGVAGELLISGPGVTLGYLDDEAATAERFVMLDGRRWYRTGDVARCRDGIVFFLGRVDDQLNVGGQRIEPAELEAVIRRLPGVRDAVVVVPAGAEILVAHLEAEQVDEAEARAMLASRVPAGWIPRRFIVHGRLPRNNHGKVDRLAAAALPLTTVGGHDSIPVERSSVLDAVTSAWRKSFDRPDIDADTDFFEIGGDSLLAVQIVSEIGDALGGNVAIATLLTGRTPAGMTELLADLPAADGARPGRIRRDAFQVVQIRPGSPSGPVVVLTPAWDDVFGYLELAGSFPDDVRVLALTYHELPGDRPVTTVDELVTESLSLIVEQLPEGGPTAIVGWSIGGVVAAEVSERLRSSGHEASVVALIDTFFPGEERHLWSNRWWKYKSLLRPGTLPEAYREVQVMGRRRLERVAGSLGRRLMTWSGVEFPAEPKRTSAGGFPVAALRHPIAQVSTPMVFYSASTTNRERTVHKWQPITRQMTVVEIAGRHRGHDSIMGPTGVGLIADDLVDKMASAAPRSRSSPAS